MEPDKPTAGQSTGGATPPPQNPGATPGPSSPPAGATPPSAQPSSGLPPFNPANKSPVTVVRNTAPPPAPPGGLQKLLGLLAKKRVWIPLVVVFLAAILGGTWLILSSHNKKAAQSESPTLEDVSSDDLKKFSNAFLTPTTSQTATFNANADFKNNVTVEKTLTAGAISTQNFNVTGAVSLDSINLKSNLFVGGGATLQGVVEARNQLNVHGALTAANASFGGNVAVTGTLSAGTLSVGDLVTKNLTLNGVLTLNGHLTPGGLAPSIESGSSAGGGSSVQIAGNDSAGTLTIHTGSAPFAGNLAKINFHTAFNGVPKVLITPVTQDAGKLQFFVSKSPNYFTVDTANAPTGDTDYSFDYWVIN